MKNQAMLKQELSLPNLQQSQSSQVAETHKF